MLNAASAAAKKCLGRAKMTNALVTGANGFAASHLIPLLLARGDMVFGTVRKGADLSRIAGLEKNKNLRLVFCDLNKQRSVADAVETSGPDFVFHLAAQSYVRGNSAAETIRTNIAGSFNLLEALRKSVANPRIHLAGSSEEYGFVHGQEVPVSEDAALNPATIYGASKTAMEFLGNAFRETYGMRTVTTRAFNHTGTGQSENFVCSSWARQIAEIELGKREPVMRVGSLEIKRDFLDVGDVAGAYAVCAEKGAAGQAYNVCSGRAFALSGILDMLLALTGKKIRVEKDPALVRKVDIPLMLGSNRKLMALGWKQHIAMEKSLADLLCYWRAALS